MPNNPQYTAEEQMKINRQNTLGMLGAGAAGQILGFGLNALGMGMQRKQAQKLQDQQIKGQKEMLDYSKAKDLEMWKATNYPAQVEQMKLAGLNPGLQYGMSGGGGVTTGGGSPSVSGQSAQMPHLGNPMDIAQLAMMAAQKANIEANTEKTKTETTKIGGVDTDEAKTRIDNMLAGIENTKARTTAENIMNRTRTIEADIAEKTTDEAIKIIGHEADRAQYSADMLFDNSLITRATRNTMIDTAKANLIYAGLKNELTKEDIKLRGKQTQLTDTQDYATLKQLSNQYLSLTIAQGGQDTQANRLAFDKWLHDLSDETKINYETVKSIIMAAGAMRSGSTTTTTGPEGTYKSETIYK